MSTSKMKSSSANPGFFAQGGKGHMFGKQQVGTQEPGMTSHSVKNGGAKFAEGGKGKMFGKQSASAAVAGQIGKNG